MRKTRLVAAAAAVIAVAGCTVTPERVAGDPAAVTAGAGASTRTPAPTPSRPAPVATPSGTPVLPTAYVPFSVSSFGVAISLPVPRDWSLTWTDHGADFGDPSGRTLLRIEIRKRTDPSAVHAWEVVEDSIGLDGYRRLGIAEVPGLGDTAADWTFVFTRDGIQRRVVDRGIGVRGAGIAIYYSAEQRSYDALLPVFDRATRELRIS